MRDTHTKGTHTPPRSGHVTSSSFIVAMADGASRRRLDSSSEEDDEPRDERVRLGEESDDSDASPKLSKEERKAARKEKKRRRKEAKKEKKERKRLRKSERSREDDDEDDEPATAGLQPPVVAHNGAAAAGEASSATSAPKLGKRRCECASCPRRREHCATSASPCVPPRSFFAQLQSEEAKKDSVGTVHATGGEQQKVDQDAQGRDDWTCYKCNATNFKQSIECHKCRAMRRLNDYR